MKFGDKVKVNLEVHYLYDENGVKEEVKEGCQYSHGIVLSKTRRATGHYCAGTTNSGYGEWDAEPPSLRVDKWHTVYKVAMAPRGTVVLVKLEDMELS